MLVLSRQRDEAICIGPDVVLTIVDIRRDKVRLGIKAPDAVVVDRWEVAQAKLRGLTTAEIKELEERGELIGMEELTAIRARVAEREAAAWSWDPVGMGA